MNGNDGYGGTVRPVSLEQLEEAVDLRELTSPKQDKESLFTKDQARFWMQTYLLLVPSYGHKEATERADLAVEAYRKRMDYISVAHSAHI